MGIEHQGSRKSMQIEEEAAKPAQFKAGIQGGKIMIEQGSSQGEQLWSLVLAGGEGERLKPFVKRWLGQHKPKQYCAFVGSRSMFQHTLDRSDRIVPPQRRVTVMSKTHSEEVARQFGCRARGKVLLQPANRDTVAGIFLGLALIRAYDPDARVLIFPSDHFVCPEERFLEVARGMAILSGQMRNRIVLLGAFPDKPEREYGWIQPGVELGEFYGCRVRTAKTFLEKPELERCRSALEAGALWNTMVIAAKVEFLWSLGVHCFPVTMDLFEEFSKAVGTAREEYVLEEIYRILPSFNFSAHLLQPFPENIRVVELRDVLWSDWGNAERIAATLRHLGHEPEICLARMAAAAS